MLCGYPEFGAGQIRPRLKRRRPACGAGKGTRRFGLGEGPARSVNEACRVPPPWREALGGDILDARGSPSTYKDSREGLHRRHQPAIDGVVSTNTLYLVLVAVACSSSPSAGPCPADSGQDAPGSFSRSVVVHGWSPLAHALQAAARERGPGGLVYGLADGDTGHKVKFWVPACW